MLNCFYYTLYHNTDIVAVAVVHIHLSTYSTAEINLAVSI